MAGKADATVSGMDTVKLAVSIGILVASVLAFYVFADQPLLYRVLGIVAAIVLAAVIALTTERGRSFASFMQDARTEVRKMVWPTRVETLQTTVVVIVVVVILALFLWIVDRGLTTLIQFVIR
ncbi:MAG: preprotein translocase subunit SecE [Gammaproteobacteria bacterium]|nr:preprotein translocase subunit SecE [Gammaproteobacteria bacterium]